MINICPLPVKSVPTVKSIEANFSWKLAWLDKTPFCKLMLELIGKKESWLDPVIPTTKSPDSKVLCAFIPVIVMPDPTSIRKFPVQPLTPDIVGRGKNSTLVSNIESLLLPVTFILPFTISLGTFTSIENPDSENLFVLTNSLSI